MTQIGTRIQNLGNFGNEGGFGSVVAVTGGFVTIEWDTGRRENMPAALLNSARIKIVS